MVRPLATSMLLAFAWALPAAVALAQEETPPAEDPIAALGWVKGPATGELGKMATIDIPKGYRFLPQGDASEFMRMYGNPSDGSELGVIFKRGIDREWFAVFEFDDSGFVEDSEKDSIDPEAILKGIREGTEASNEERVRMGSSPMHIVGWYEKPNYNSATKNLEWAIHGQADAAEGKVDVINHNVRILGRRGVMQAVLVDDPTHLPLSIDEFRSLLGGFSYNDGERYADFREGDKVAAYGLAALIAGGAAAAAAKSGLLAKFGKLIVVGLLVLFAPVIKLFKMIFGKNQGA